MTGELAVMDSKKDSITTLSGDIVPSPGDNLPVASIPVSMVVHGGTGVLHGNMTSLTVNQYIGMVPGQGHGVWDSSMVRELVADAVKISTDANSQLFQPSEPAAKHATTSGVHKKLVESASRRGWWLLLTLLIITSTAVLVSTSLYTKFSSSPPPSSTSQQSNRQLLNLPNATPDLDLGSTSPLPENDSEAPRILQRSFWLARPSRGIITKSVLPLHRVVVCDTQTDECHNQDECVDIVRNQQRFDMNTDKLQDISFNFLVGGEGNVYVGRGWDLQGAHTKHNNVGALGVALIGTFSEVPPSSTQLKALVRLINTGVDNDKISNNYTLVIHCQLREDGYPGKALARQLSSWPHFDHSYNISTCT